MLLLALALLLLYHMRRWRSWKILTRATCIILLTLAPMTLDGFTIGCHTAICRYACPIITFTSRKWFPAARTDRVMMALDTEHWYNLLMNKLWIGKKIENRVHQAERDIKSSIKLIYINVHEFHGKDIYRCSLAI